MSISLILFSIYLKGGEDGGSSLHGHIRVNGQVKKNAYKQCEEGHACMWKEGDSLLLSWSYRNAIMQIR